MESIVIPSLINLTCSFVYDNLKKYKIKYKEDKISKIVGNFITEEIDNQLDSGSLSKYLSSYQTKVNFENYFLYNAYSIKLDLGAVNIIYKKEVFAKQMALSANTFMKMDVNKNIDILLLEKYFDKVINTIEKSLIKHIPKELMAISYFQSSRFDELEKLIKENIFKPLTLPQTEYEIIRKEYITNIQTKYNRSHIYGKGYYDFYSFYVFPTFIAEQGVNKTRNKEYTTNYDGDLQWQYIFNQANIISIIGGAGFGKSLFLHNLINKYTELNISEASSVFPIYCNLKNYMNFSEKKAYSIENFLIDSIIDCTGIDKSKINREFLEYYIETGRCLILFDALDEVESEYREDLNSKLVSFFSSINKNNKICITSRDRGFIPQTEIVYKVKPVDKNQIINYLDKMKSLGLFDELDNQIFIDQCNQLINKGFLNSFLILSLLVNIFQAERELPENKIDLYDKCINFISKKREIDFKKLNYNFSLIRSILDSSSSFEKLSNLAKYTNKEIYIEKIKELLLDTFKRSYSDENETSNAINEFLKFCSERTELFVLSNKEDYYIFYHRSFFEYYYAKYILKEKNTNEKLYEELLNFSLDAEIFELVAAILKRDDLDRYMNFLDYVILKVNQMERDISFSDEKNNAFFVLTLLLQISSESYYIKEYYNIIFNSKKILAFVPTASNLDRTISSLIFRAKDKEALYSDLVTFYRNELIAAHIYLYINKEVKESNRVIRFEKINLSFVFGIMRNKLSMNNQIMSLIDELSIDNIENILSSYCSTCRTFKSKEAISLKEACVTLNDKGLIKLKIESN